MRRSEDVRLPACRHGKFLPCTRAQKQVDEVSECFGRHQPQNVGHSAKLWLERAMSFTLIQQFKLRRERVWSPDL